MRWTVQVVYDFVGGSSFQGLRLFQVVTVCCRLVLG